MGHPSIVKTLLKTSSSLRHIKTGLFERSSARIQPTDQISTPKRYSSLPRIISGALYQRETMAFDLRRYRKLAFLARPKSASLSLPNLSIRMLSGFMSLCRIIFECKISTASSSSLINFYVYTTGTARLRFDSSLDRTLSQNSKMQCIFLVPECSSSRMSSRRTNCS